MRLTLLALLLLGSLTIVPGADAKPRWVPTRVALGPADGESIRGELFSQVKACVRERMVWLIDAGTGSIFQTTTARNGRLTVRLEDIPTETDTVIVKATTTRIGNRICERDTADVAIDFVTLDGGYNNGAFGGVIFSSVPACEPSRLILLYEVSSEPTLAGSNFTDASGAWTIAPATGTWQAQAEPLFLGAGDAYAYCHAVASNAWFYEEPPPE